MSTRELVAALTSYARDVESEGREYAPACMREAARRLESQVEPNLATLHANGSVILLPNGDELALTPEAVDAHLSNEAERAGLAADEAYYGGDGPPGCYGPDDKRGT